MSSNPLLQSMSAWFRRTFSDPAAISLFFVLLLGVIFIEFFGDIFAPILTSVVVAYLLQSVVRLLQRCKLPHLLAVILTFIFFVAVLVFAIIGVLPLLWHQLTTLIHQLPSILSESQQFMNKLIARYPQELSGLQSEHLLVLIKAQAAKFAHVLLTFSLAGISSLVSVVLYLILVPILVFFMLKDRAAILTWFSGYLPANRSLLRSVWLEVNEQIGSYVRGRVIEIILIATVASSAFAVLGLQYAVLLGSLVGLSVIIPYIGVVLVTIPVILVGLMQWGLSAHFIYLMITYLIIVILDGNVLVPVLFSETLGLHPVVIILSVIIFGAFWGFWGVFFSIPLAALIHAVLKAWPKAEVPGEQAS